MAESVGFEPTRPGEYRVRALSGRLHSSSLPRFRDWTNGARTLSPVMGTSSGPGGALVFATRYLDSGVSLATTCLSCSTDEEELFVV